MEGDLAASLSNLFPWLTILTIGNSPCPFYPVAFCISATHDHCLLPSHCSPWICIHASDYTAGNGLNQGRFKFDTRKNFSSKRVVKPWKRLPREEGSKVLKKKKSRCGTLWHALAGMVVFWTWPWRSFSTLKILWFILSPALLVSDISKKLSLSFLFL